MSIIKKSQTLFCLESAPWLTEAGISKGLHHDRQHLGIILSAGQMITVRQTNPDFKDKLRLCLYNVDKANENSVHFDSKEESLTAKDAAVAFVDTPYVDRDKLAVQPVVEFEYPDDAKSLPVYKEGDDESAFFKSWDSGKSEFALLESDYTIMLIPDEDKEKVRKLDGGKKKIQDLFDFYRDIFGIYNDLAGLSFSTPIQTDKNIANRYFFKANKGGRGGASYGYYYIDAHGTSVKPWLSMEASSWARLHEIGHGYQISFIKDQHTSFLEVWNNIFAAWYQEKRLGEDKYKKGWLYEDGKQASIEKTISDALKAGTPISKWQKHEKLYFLMQMIFSAGTEGFTERYRQYRIAKNVDSYYPFEKEAVLDRLSGLFTQKGNRVDVTPFINAAGAFLSVFQHELNHFSGAPAVYPANQFVQGDTLKNLRQTLSLNGDLSLVSVGQLKTTGLNGDVYLDIGTPVDFERQLKNKDIIIMDGAACVKKITLTKTGTLPKFTLPIGVYTLRVPTGRNKKKEAQIDYLIVKPGSNRIKLPIWDVWFSKIGSQRIELTGFGDNLFATVTINQGVREVEVDILHKDPHSGYGSKEYARIVLRDADDKEMLYKSIPGKGAVTGYETVGFNVDDTLEIYHREHGHHVVLEPKFNGVINTKVATNKFITTGTGLKNKELLNDPFDALENAINTAAVILRNYTEVLKSDYAQIKVHIWLAINGFPEPRRDRLLKKYKDCIPSDNG